jgi:hypothetical protein
MKIVSVTAKGSVEARFDRASFLVSITNTGNAGHEAKLAVLGIAEKLKSVLLGCAEKGLSELETSTLVEPLRIQNSHVGYKVTQTTTFQCSKVSEALSVHEQLTNIPGVVAEPPVFHLVEEGETTAKAFKHAYEAARRKFDAQCVATGLKPDLWELMAWQVVDETPQGKVLPGRASLGSTTFTINVRFQFKRKRIPPFMLDSTDVGV